MVRSVSRFFSSFSSIVGKYLKRVQGFSRRIVSEIDISEALKNCSAVLDGTIAQPGRALR